MRHGVRTASAAAAAILALAGCSEEAPLDEAGSALDDVGEVEEAEAADDTTTAPRATSPKKKTARLVAVAEVIDGDTLALVDGRRVRLVQIDAPEVNGSECFAGEATETLESLLPRGSRIRLEADPRLDREDQYGRLLRYVFTRRTNVNVALVRRGAASVWFYEGDRGRYADILLAAARRARSERRGLWRACPGTRLDPYAAVDTSDVQAAPAYAAGGGGTCDASYRGACIPSPPPDLDCAQVEGPFAVVGPDPHRFDGDRDGIGCE